jgi:hypothetical protein
MVKDKRETKEEIGEEILMQQDFNHTDLPVLLVFLL